MRTVQTKGPWPHYGTKERLKRLRRWLAATAPDEAAEVAENTRRLEALFSAGTPHPEIFPHPHAA